jgi:ubiquinone/menaquinone biosynthesis C-methylase UbiE
MPDINAVISELARVTKEDATIMVVDTTVPSSETLKRAYKRIANWQGNDLEEHLSQEFSTVERVRVFDMGLGFILKAKP